MEIVLVLYLFLFFFSIPVALVSLVVACFFDRDIMKNMYVKICLCTLIPFLVFALSFIPFFGKEYGDSYYVWSRSIVLSTHYWVAVLYFCRYYYLWKSKKLLIIPTLILQILLFICFFKLSYFFWFAI